MGVWRGQYSWVRIESTHCDAPPKRLLEVGGRLPLRPPFNVSERSNAFATTQALRASFTYRPSAAHSQPPPPPPRREDGLKLLKLAQQNNARTRGQPGGGAKGAGHHRAVRRAVAARRKRPPREGSSGD